MSTRIFQTIWKLQSLGCMRNKLCSTAYIWRSYATGFHGAAIQISSVSHCRNSAPLPQQTSMTVPRMQYFSTDNDSSPQQKSETENNQKETVKIEHVLQGIDKYYKNNGIVNFDAFARVLNVLEEQKEEKENGDVALQAREAMFLLRACGDLIPSKTSDERMELFQRLWDYLEARNQIIAEHYEIALEVRIKNCAPLPDYQEFIETVRSKAPDCLNSTLYERLVRLACECGDIEQAKEILAEMRENEYPLTEYDFNSLLIGHGCNGDLEGINTVLESMAAANLPPSIETKTMLVCAFIENEKVDGATEILKEYEDAFSTEQIMRMLTSTIKIDSKVAYDIMGVLLKALTKELVVSTEVPIPLRNFCIKLIHAGKQDQAIDVLTLLPTPEFTENQDTDTFGTFLLQECFRAQVPVLEIIEICEILTDNGKNERALHVATEICLRRNPPAVLSFFEALAKKEPLRPHYFWPLMMYNCRRWGDTGIFRTLKIMHDFGVECDNDTLTYHVLPALEASLEHPEQALKSFIDSGVKTTLVIAPMLAHLLAQNNIEQAHKVAQLYQSKINCLELVQPLVNTAPSVRSLKRYHNYAKLIQALAKKSDNSRADFVGQLVLDILTKDTRLSADISAIHRMLSEFQKFALQLSVAAAELIGTHLNKKFKKDDHDAIHKLLRDMSNYRLTLPNDSISIGKDAPKTYSVTTHPRDMKREELECHLIELEAKNLNTRGVLRRLLQLCVRDGKLERALEVKRKCDELKVNVSPGMLASIFDMYTKLKDLPNAEKAYNDLLKTFPNFQVDEHKVIDFASLLVEQNQYEAAKSILSNRAANHKIIGGDYVARNVWHYLNNVAHMAATLDLPKKKNLTRDTLELLQQLGYCDTQNAVFGPVIREYLLRNDLRAAIEEFRRIVETFKRTPLQFELLTLLVRLSNQDQKDENIAASEDCKRYGIPAEEAQTLLTELTQYTTKVYGVENMNTSLVLAFAESGTEQQLRRLMVDPDFCVNEKLLLKNCDYLSEEGSLQTLLRLARSSRGLHIINEQNIYDLILLKLKEKNNCDGALQFFERLESDDEMKISQDFINNLVSLLRINNVSIPSKLAMRAKILN